MSLNWVTKGTSEWVCHDIYGTIHATIRKNPPGKLPAYTGSIATGQHVLGYSTLRDAKKGLEGDYREQLDNAHALVADLKTQVSKLEWELRDREINPPVGARAMVGNFTAEGLRAIADIAIGPKVVKNLGLDTGLLVGGNLEQLNDDLRTRGGIPATLLTAASGGVRPPLLTVDDVVGILSISSPAEDEMAIRLAIQKLAGMFSFHIDPGNPNPSAKAQTVAAKLLERPELAHEVLLLLASQVKS